MASLTDINTVGSQQLGDDVKKSTKVKKYIYNYF